MKTLFVLLFYLCLIGSGRTQDHLSLVKSPADPHPSAPENVPHPIRGQYQKVDFTIMPDADDVEEMKAHGVYLHSFIPPHSYILRLDNPEFNPMILSKWFTNMTPVPTEMKSAGLSHLPETTRQDQEQSYLISAYRREDLPLLRDRLTHQGLTCKTSPWIPGTSLILEHLHIQQVRDLLNEPLVARIDVYRGPPRAETSAHSMMSNQIFALNYDGLGPTGRQTYFSNIEHFGANAQFRLNTRGRNHPVYGTRYADSFETLQQSHGTQVTMYAAGMNNVNEYEDRGMAPDAVLVQMPAYDSIESYYTHHQLQPMTLNVSAGVGGNTVDYNEGAREFDRITRSLGGFLLCFSAGNEGHEENPFLGYGPGWANISSEDKTSKNNFTVHSAGRPGDHYDWTSKGPTTDGRLKPDISAEGQLGTSFASPNLAGLIQVLYESYIDAYQQPARSDVVKAVILNTAIDTDKKGIDFKTGFGAINPVRAHRVIEKQQLFTGTFPQGTGHQSIHTLDVPEGMRELKVLLYWHDVAGDPAAYKALVNDLDLILLTPDGEELLPWTLDPTPGLHYNLPLRKQDTLNNVEQITLLNPSPGQYQLIVSGTKVPMGPQPYVLTYDVLPYHIEITSPAEGFRTARGKRILFTWNAALDTTAGSPPVEVWLESGIGEPQLMTTVPVTKLYYEFEVPFNFPFTASARCIVRQQGTGIADTSGYFHVMQTPGGLAFKAFCEEEVTLTWLPVAIEGTRYIIYRLGEKVMEPVAEILHPLTMIALGADSILPPGQSFSRSEWFAISAVHPNGATSLRSLPVSAQQTNLLNTSTLIRKTYTLCFGDSVTVNALELEYDSIRWFHQQQPLPQATSLSLKIKGDRPGAYHYTVYQKNGCRFDSDTFFVRGPLDFTDTLDYGPKVWNISVFRQHDRRQYYGQLTIRELSLQSERYYSEFEHIDDAPGYQGCAPGNIYTISYKRKGFTKGYYRLDLKFIQHSMRLYIDNHLVYTSPANMANVGLIWEGYLDEASSVRVEHTVLGKALIHLAIEPVEWIRPADITDGLMVWLKGDRIRTGPDGRVSHWLDDYIYSLQNRADSSASIHPLPSGMNYHDALRFGRQSGVFGDFPQQFFSNEATTFAVFRMNSSSDPNARIMGLGLPPVYGDDDYQGTYAPFRRMGISDHIGTTRQQLQAELPGERLNTWQLMSLNMKLTSLNLQAADGEALTVPHAFQSLFYKSYTIGCKPDTLTDDGQLDGDIAEILHFSRSLSLSEEQRVRSYLGLKYGLTLEHPYLAADGRIVYDPGPYRYNIAGLAREDQAGWMQRQSTSQSPEADIFTGSTGMLTYSNAMNTNDLLTDKSYLVWGHNGAAAAFSVSENDSTQRMARIWKMTQSGEVGSFRFHFKADTSSTFDGCASYFLKVSEEEDVEIHQRHDLQWYVGGDGQAYLYADVSLAGIQQMYFTIQRVNRDQLWQPLMTMTSSGDTYCIQEKEYRLTDTTGLYRVGAVVGLISALSPSHVQAEIRTDHTPDMLLYCDAQMSYAVINRIMYITSASTGTDLVDVDLAMDDQDSLRAADMLMQTGSECKHSDAQLKWWIEPDAATLMNKIQSGQALGYIDEAQLEQRLENGVRVIRWKGIAWKGMVLGAILVQAQTTGTGPVVSTDVIKIRPNPFRDQMSIEGLESGDEIRIYSMLGREVYRGTATSDVHLVEGLPYAPVYQVIIGHQGRVSSAIRAIRLD